MLAGRKKYALIAAVVVAGLAATSIALSTSVSTRPTPIPKAHRSSLRPANWDLIQAAASLRHNALAPHRTAFHRSFAAYLGLSALL